MCNEFRFWNLGSFSLGDASACTKVSQSVIEDSSRCAIDSSAGILFVQSDISIAVRLFNFSSQQYLGILLNLIFGNIVFIVHSLVYWFFNVSTMYFIYCFDFYSWNNYMNEILTFSYMFLYFKLATKTAQFNFFIFYFKKLYICDCCEGSQARWN